MLELLSRYSREHGLDAVPGFSRKTVRWAIHVAPDGRFLGILELGHAGTKGNRGIQFPKCPDLTQPEIKRGGKGCRHFLADNAEVVALHHPEVDGKLEAKHAYFKGLLADAAQAVPDLAGASLCLEDPSTLEDIRQQLLTQKVKPGDNITFAIHGFDPPFPVEWDSWHSWWQTFRQTLAKPPTQGKGQGPTLRRCLVSGELVQPALTHQKIKGLSDVGGLTQGDVLAPFKQASFRSYGLVQAENAPVSEAKVSEYRSALNHLIAETGRRLGNVKVVHWFKERVPPEGNPLAAMFDGLAWDESAREAAAQSSARELLESIYTGESWNLGGNRFYALTLSGASGRVMIRDWMEGSFEELVGALTHWFDSLEIVRRDGQALAKMPKFMAVLGGLVRDLDDLPAPVITTLWRVALLRLPIPRQLMAMAYQRVKVDAIQDETPRHARLGLLKAYHVRNGDNHMKPHLNEEHPDPAYHCGRLLAVLAAVQYSALGDVGAGIVQRYYAAASATPALVLGRLVRTSQFHLEKLSGGLKHWYEDKIASIMVRIDGDFPQILQLDQQSLFALGYYQQLASDRNRNKSTENTSEEN